MTSCMGFRGMTVYGVQNFMRARSVEWYELFSMTELPLEHELNRRVREAEDTAREEDVV